ncbi:transposase [Hymenobacter sp. HD11105]
MPPLVTYLHQRLRAQGLPLLDLVANTNYAIRVNYALLEQQGITPWIPVFGQYKPTVEGFAYDAQADCFTCPAGKLLPFKSYDKQREGGLQKLYRAANRDCRLCPHKVTCAPKSKKRQITRTAYDPLYQQALLRQQRPQGHRMRVLRQSTVEPVVGSLLQHYGLRQVNSRGRASAHKTMLLAALAYTLKKLLKYPPQQRLGLAGALPKPPPPPYSLPF